MDQLFDWKEVVDRNPVGYLELNDGKSLYHGRVESVSIDDGTVIIKLKWAAWRPLAHGLPIGEWEAVPNEPIAFPNMVVQFVIEDTPEKGDRVRFGMNILYFTAPGSLEPSQVRGLEVVAASTAFVGEKGIIQTGESDGDGGECGGILRL